MQEVYYTHALWRVRQGNEDEFVQAWKSLGEAFSQLRNAPKHGTLIQSLTDPTLFYSFGPWDSLEDIQEMRDNPQCQEAIQRVIGLCDEAAPSNYRVVAEIRN